MGRIRVLDEVLADQIAAGEVVERPASVVKELLENSVDAGASAITVEIADGGVGLLRVVDDGHGMDRDDALLALKRHATSKIRTSSDLSHIRTLGFRGEALPSIASVSRFSLRTRQPDTLGAIRVSTEGGKNHDVREAPGPVGTEIRVEDLFFNVPARRKFLKKPTTESAHVQDAVQRLALCYPGIAFRLIKDGRTAFDLPSHATLLERSRAIFGQRATQDLAIVRLDGGFAVEGLIGSPRSARATGRHYHTFINGRFVRDRVIMAAVRSAYGTRLERGRHPFVVLKLTLPPEALDVNVHPAKTEVRFVDSSGIHRLITKALDQTLRTDPWAPGAEQQSATRARPARAPAPHASRTYSLSGGAPGPAPEGGGLADHRRRVFDAMERIAARRPGLGGAGRRAGTEGQLELGVGGPPPLRLRPSTGGRVRAETIEPPVGGPPRTLDAPPDDRPWPTDADRPPPPAGPDPAPVQAGPPAPAPVEAAPADVARVDVAGPIAPVAGPDDGPGAGQVAGEVRPARARPSDGPAPAIEAAEPMLEGERETAGAAADRPAPDDAPRAGVPDEPPPTAGQDVFVESANTHALADPADAGVAPPRHAPGMLGAARRATGLRPVGSRSRPPSSSHHGLDGLDAPPPYRHVRREDPAPAQPPASSSWGRPTAPIDELPPLPPLAPPAAPAVIGPRRGPRTRPTPPTLGNRPALAEVALEKLQPLGSADGLLYCAAADGVVAIDLLGAGHRIRFDRLRAGSDGVTLARPAKLELDADDRARFAERREALEALGFAIEPFGGSTFVAQRLPPGLIADDLDALLADVLALPMEDEHPLLDRLAARCADVEPPASDAPLSPAEGRRLLERLAAVKHIAPRPQPFAVILTTRQLRRKLGAG